MNNSSIRFPITVLLFSFALISSCNGQKETAPLKDNINQAKSTKNILLDADPYFVESQSINSSYGPSSITRNILQDNKGNIWLATWEGIIRYDGKFFTNFTNKEGLRQFHAFCLLEDKTGNLWFGTIGAGVYRYDGQSFTNFTTKEGLASDRVGCIYEDKKGNIWLGTDGGISLYDGETFTNFTTKDGLTDNDINAIIEDKSGKFWIGSRGLACTYDGNTFTKLTNEEGMAFGNIRSIIEDKKGNIWLGGNGGFWSYKDQSFTNHAKGFVGMIYEDSKGNIWTSSAFNGNANNWVLSRYDEKLIASPIKKEENMFFGIMEDKAGGIWLGSLNGVCRYDGKTFNYFKPIPPANSSLQIPSGELNPLEEQHKNMLGKWVSVNPEQEGMDILELFEDGHYLLVADSVRDRGKWRIVDVHHLSLGDVKYRFYFKRKNLVLDDDKGNSYELEK